MEFIFAPILQNEKIIATHLQPEHFDVLYKAVSNPKIWEQHPNPNRYKLEEFTNYFEGAIKEGTAYLIQNAITKEVIGCSRFYGFNQQQNCITIGYTFFITSCWGKGYNKSLKQLMLNYAFKFVHTVHFTIGAVNKRSQIAITRLGATKIKEEVTSYYGEQPKLDFIYAITKKEWLAIDKTVD